MQLVNKEDDSLSQQQHQQPSTEALLTSLNLTYLVSSSEIRQEKSDQENIKDFYVGLSLALLSSFFIGSSFILKKKGLLKLSIAPPSSSNGSVLRAGQGGYGYLKEWLWWAGLLTMGVGELCNFAAYGFAPATLVTPLGALSVLVSAVMANYFLNEKLNSIGKIGCFLTAIGSTVMVIHAPKEGEVHSVKELLTKLQNPEFIVFTLFSIGALLLLIFMLGPRYGSKNVLVYILICSILGSFTVMSCKGLSLGFKEIFSHTKVQKSASFMYTYMFAFIVISCIIMQMNYLNKALDIFNTAIVTTIYYVLFTLCVMIASSILFKELANVAFIDFVGCVAGFATIVCALCLIHFFKSDNQFIDDLKAVTAGTTASTTASNSALVNFKIDNAGDDDDDDDDNTNTVIHNSGGYLGNNKIIKRFLNTLKSENSLNNNNNSNSNNLGSSNSSYILLSTNSNEHGDDNDQNLSLKFNNNSIKSFNELI